MKLQKANDIAVVSAIPHASLFLYSRRMAFLSVFGMTLLKTDKRPSYKTARLRKLMAT
ncbi:MAG: hypothetical protein AB8B55_14855 [Mariniblastus sp.]